MELDDIISKEKGLSIDVCIKKADKYIKKNGICLLLLDVKGSSKYEQPDELTDTLKKIVQELNNNFDTYLPEHSLLVYNRKEKGFGIILGDALCAGINNSNIIKKVEKHLNENYPQVGFYWGIAEDGWDKEGLKVIR